VSRLAGAASSDVLMIIGRGRQGLAERQGDANTVVLALSLRRRAGGRAEVLRTEVRMTTRRGLLLAGALALLAVFALSRGDSARTRFDYEAACGTAHARVETPDDVRAILVTIESSGVLDDLHPQPTDVRRHEALVSMLSITVPAPAYPIPSGFTGRLPEPPDYARVRELQRQLAAACE
jgi:hypothetical protein